MILTLTLGATLIVATNAGLSLGPCGPEPPTAEEFSVDRVGNWVVCQFQYLAFFKYSLGRQVEKKVL